jgi:hypothetical protein
MRIQAITALTAILLVSGCSTVGELEQSKPYAILHSQEPAQTVAQCIRDAWQSQRIGIEANGAQLEQSNGVYVVVSPPGGLPSEVAKVQSSGKSTLVQIFTQASLDLGGRKGKRVAAAKTCIQE